jgi:Mn2+/Fe2+ NRAMP family transporter
MSARLGLVTRIGLADTIRAQVKQPWLRYSAIAIILCAILLGNTAYEAGNLGGASLGLEALLGAAWAPAYPWLVAALAFCLLWRGNYKLLEKAFVTLVLLMSASFLLTAIITKPDWTAVLKGLFVPEVPGNGILTIIALVGTTVVPYNLFLHASLVTEKWTSANDLATVRLDTVVSILLGGIVSLAIVISAAALPSGEILSAMDLARGLEPLYGRLARYFMGIGLFAAGITSAITAPLAAAYVANSCFGWHAGMKDLRFRAVWAGILLVGAGSLSLGLQPLIIIRFAQVANGMLLPLIAIFLLWAVNTNLLPLKYRNNRFQNIMGTTIIVLAFILGLKSIFKVLGILG